MHFSFQNLTVDPNTTTNYLCPQATAHLGNTRRHTVGPGDVAHEQAFGGNPAVNPVNFKFGAEAGTNIPINLPMLQNQPLHNFTIKDQHLLKPPTVMGASMLSRRQDWMFVILIIIGQICVCGCRFIWTASVRRWC